MFMVFSYFDIRIDLGLLLFLHHFWLSRNFSLKFVVDFMLWTLRHPFFTFE